MPSRYPSLGAYHSALRDYLSRNDETGLSSAYDLGRFGLESGCGLLQVVHVHEKALGIILDSTPAGEDFRNRVHASTKFLTEALSPFGLASDGYRHLIKIR